jgi:Tol biopolymer transport system component
MARRTLYLPAAIIAAAVLVACAADSQTGTQTVGTDIWVMNADGTSPRNITNTTSWYEFSPDWQPIPQATP